jgi:hypothetical protein
MIKKFIFAAFLSTIISTSLAAAPRGIVSVNSPTANTIGRGSYHLSFLGYDNGGVELKTLIGLHDSLYLGVSFDIQNAIGYDSPQPNVPGVIARLRFTDGSEGFPLAIAAGYDSFYIGSYGRTYNADNELNRMIYGPYLVFTGSIYLFDSEQFGSFGFRVPAQPHYTPEDTSYFTGIDIPLGSSFNFKSELERVYWNFKHSDEWLVNFGLRYTYLEQLGIEAAILWEFGEKPNRVLRIEYRDIF